MPIKKLILKVKLLEVDISTSSPELPKVTSGSWNLMAPFLNYFKVFLTFFSSHMKYFFALKVQNYTKMLIYFGKL